MHLTMLLRRRVLAGVAVLAGITGGAAVAQQPAPLPAADVKVDKNTGSLIVPLGGTVRFDVKKPMTDTLVRNEDVLLARPDPMSPNVLLLTGRLAGATQITITFTDKTRAVYDVVVQPDYDLLRSVIRRTVPTATVDVVPGVGQVIILTGFVTRPEDSDTIMRIASAAVGGNVNNIVNALQIGGAQHVLIDVVIAQVDRTELRERGINFGIQGTDVGFSSVLGSLAVSTVGAGAGGGFGITPTPSANIVTGIVPSSTLVAIRALRVEGLAKFLSEPKIITQTGRPAFLRAGGQQAVIGPTSGINGPGVALENVGTQLEVLPIVFGNGKIYLEVNPQFRSVNNGRGISLGGSFTPGFNDQTTRSSVMLESGQTFAIGGLLETEVQASSNRVPYLGDLPFIGAAFSVVSHSEHETEMVILVTPRLVDAMDCAQVPRRVPGRESRSPDDYELFLEGILEAPRGQRKVWNGNCYVPAYKCDPSYSLFPCQGNVCAGGVGAACGTAGGCATPAVGGHLAPAPVPAPVPVIPSGGELPPVSDPIPMTGGESK